MEHGFGAGRRVIDTAKLFRWTGFAAVDRDAGWRGLVDSLAAMTEQPLNTVIEEAAIAMMGCEGPVSVLELGCGLGDRARRIAAACPAGSRVVAVDNSQKLLGLARERAGRSGVDFRYGDARALEWEDGTFDVVTAQRFLLGFPDPAPVVAEMVRVLRPRGRIVLTDFDPASILQSGPGDIPRRFMEIYLPSFDVPYIGRSLPALLAARGIEGLAVDMFAMAERSFRHLQRIIPFEAVLEAGVAAGALDPGEPARWIAAWEEQERQGAFLYSVNVITTAGRKP